MSTATPTPPTALVTGASTGVGYDTARQLVADGHTVLLHARTPGQSADAVARLTAAGADPSRLHAIAADFANLDEVRRMAAQVTEAHNTLDLLVNAAATAGTDHRVSTEDGNELTLQINYLAPFLLTRLLDGPMGRAAGSRVVNLSSTLHRGASVNWTDINRAHRYTRLAAYTQSKLALTMFTRALTELRPGAFTALSVDPGTADRALLRLHGTATPAAHDSGHVVATLCSPRQDVTNGAFYDRLQPAATAPCVADRRATARLLKLSAHLTRLS
ncbi:SDR family NAD(P)-dependent oxidoreductase [Solihabitans fulvus]|nr:SDR family NAD(P)-dependent oxidoreductase [Solihabitans fulvus]